MIDRVNFPDSARRSLGDQGASGDGGGEVPKGRPRASRAARIVLAVLTAIVAFLAIAGAVAAWRLATGPIQLGFLTPLVARALGAAIGDAEVQLEDTVLVWAGWKNNLETRAKGVRVLRSDGTVLATAPEVGVNLSFQALIRGVIAPTSLDIYGARLRIQRDSEGQFVLGVGEGASTPGEDLTGMLAGLVAGSGGTGGLRYLSAITIRDSTATIEDVRRNIPWDATIRTLTLNRRTGGMRLAGALQVVAAGSALDLRFDGAHDRAAKIITLSAAFSGLDPAALAKAVPELAEIKAISMMLGGTIDVRMSEEGNVDRIEFAVGGGPGQIVLPAMFKDGVSVDRFDAQGRVSDRFSRVLLKNVTLALGQPVITMSGLVDDVLGKGRFQIEAAVTNVPFNDLGRYWPHGLADGGRRWVLANMADGAAKDTRLTASGHLGLDGAERTTLSSLQGTIDFSGMTVQYLPKMPVVRQVHGQATFDQTRIDVAIKGGSLDAITLAGGEAKISGLDKSNQFADIDLRVAGPLRDALVLIDHDPLFFAQKLSINPSEMGGSASIGLNFRIPLIDSLRLDQLGINADAIVEKLTWHNALLGRDVADGTLDLKIDGKGMTGKGNVQLAKVPIEVRWTENFSRTAAEATRVEMYGVLTDSDRNDLGLGMEPYLSGPVGIRAVLTSAKQHMKLAAEADLTRATLLIDEVSWKKPPGTEVKVRLSSDIARSSPMALAFEASGAGVQTRGQIKLSDQNKGVREVAFDRFVYGRSDVRGGVVMKPEGGYAMQVTGASIDAERWLNSETEKTAPKDAKLAAEALRAKRRTMAAQGYTPLEAHIDVKRLWLSKDRALDGFTAAVVRERAGWKSLEVDAKLGQTATPIRVRYGPAQGKYRQLTINSDDAGTALKVFGISDGVIGGALQVTGTEDTREAPLKGEALMKNYRVTNAPLLARILSVASFTGILQTMSGTGLNFDKFKAMYSYADGLIEVTEGATRSADLGFTVEGKIDLDADTLDLKGLIVPAYTINSILSNIPIIGNIFAPGGGVFAATYSVRGGMDDPSVSVNPLAALTPGFLRYIFNIFEGGTPPTPSEQTRPGDEPQ
jgi:uncharacterized protein YhdP